MRDAKFEWDDRKAAANLRKHGIAFEDARAVFADTGGFERLDMDETGEERLILTGFSGLRLLTVVFVHRGSLIRIVSARKATKHEQREYISENP